MFTKGNRLAEKQFCIKGHDTYIVGRTGKSSCRQCKRDWQKEYQTKYRDFYRLKMKKYNSKDYTREKAWKRQGINCTVAHYNDLFSIQKGLCAICKVPQTEIFKNFAVDHSHESGQVRELLCDRCNKLLGHINENKQILISAISYLERWGAI